MFLFTGLFLVAYYVLLMLICIPVTFIQLKLGGVLNCGIVRLFSHYVPVLKGDSHPKCTPNEILPNNNLKEELIILI